MGTPTWFRDVNHIQEEGKPEDPALGNKKGAESI